MQKPPAFPLYARDFLSGSARMSLQEVGAYIRLLCHEWDCGDVPSIPKVRARLIGCSLATERKIWAAIRNKFELRGDAYINARLERERQKQAAWAEKSHLGGLARASQSAAKSQAKPQPIGQPNPSIASASPSAVQTAQTPSVRAAPLLMSPLAYDRRKQSCAYVGARLDVPGVLHAELRKSLGGIHADEELFTWYAQLDEKLEASGEAIAPDVWRWMRAQYAQWCEATGRTKTAQDDAAMDRAVEELRARGFS